MDFFNFTKYQTIDENIPYSAMLIYKLLSNKMTLDELFKRYAEKNDLIININLERILLLSITFLYSLGKIQISNGMLERCNK